MGDCRYCGQPAGLLKSEHQNCVAQYLEAASNIRTAISRAWSEERVAAALPRLVEKFATDGRLREPDRRELAIVALAGLANEALADRVLTVDEEHRLMRLASDLGFASADLQRAGISEPLTKAAVLRDLDEGVIKSARYA